MRRPRPGHRPVPAGARRRRASPPERFAAVLHRVRAKLDGRWPSSARPTVLACSHVAADSVDDLDLTRRAAARASATLAAEHGVTIAFEALAWGRHVNRVGQAWERRRARRPPRGRRWPSTPSTCSPAATTAPRSPASPATGSASSRSPTRPLLRHGRARVEPAPPLLPRPGHARRHRGRRGRARGRLPRPGLAGGVQRRGARGRPRRDRAGRHALAGVPRGPARRAGCPTRGAAAVTRRPPAPAAPTPRSSSSPTPTARPAAALLGRARLRPRRASTAASRSTWWRNGDAHVVAQPTPPGPRSRWHAPRGGRPAGRPPSRPGPRPCCGRRSTAPAAPARRCCPGITSPAGRARVRQRRRRARRTTGGSDFVPSGRRRRRRRRGWPASTTSGSPYRRDGSTRRSASSARVFGLVPGAGRGVHGAAGRLRSRALRPARGRPRLVLNVEDVAVAGARAGDHPGGVRAATTCWPRCGCCAARGVPLMAVPDNYYVDLDARFDLRPRTVRRAARAPACSTTGSGDGELLHVYTDVLRDRVLRRAAGAPRRVRRLRQPPTPTCGWPMQAAHGRGHPRTTYADWMRRPPRLLVLLLLPTPGRVRQRHVGVDRRPEPGEHLDHQPEHRVEPGRPDQAGVEGAGRVEENHSLDQMQRGHAVHVRPGEDVRLRHQLHRDPAPLAAQLPRDRRRRHLRHRRRRPAGRPPDPRGRPSSARRSRPGTTAAVYAEGMPRRCAADNGGPLRRQAQPLGLLRRRARPRAAATTSRPPGSGRRSGRAPAQRRHGHPGPVQRRPRLRPLATPTPGSAASCGRCSPGRTGSPAGWPSCSPPTRTSTTTRATRCSRWCCTAASRRGVVDTPLTHYSLSGLLSAVTGTRPLGEAGTAPSMAAAFELPLARG